MDKAYVEHTCDILQGRWPVLSIVKLFIGERFWCVVRSSHSVAHHGKSPGFQSFCTTLREILRQLLKKAWRLHDPIIIEYPNAAHIPFSQIPICYPKYSTMYPCTCMGGT